MNRTITLLLLCALSMPIQAYDCTKITETAKKAYEDNRNLGRSEVAKTQEEGGAFGPPVQSKDVGCSTDVWGAISGLSILDSVVAIFPPAINAILKSKSKEQVEKTCDRIRERAEEERSKIGKYL